MSEEHDEKCESEFFGAGAGTTPCRCAARAPRTLTARSIKSMLTRRGIDWSKLVLTELPDAGSVRIDGPDAARKAATSALVLNYDNPVRDMWIAPYADHDILTRR